MLARPIGLEVRTVAPQIHDAVVVDLDFYVVARVRAPYLRLHGRGIAVPDNNRTGVIILYAAFAAAAIELGSQESR
jgi:hypothetical protein